MGNQWPCLARIRPVTTDPAYSDRPSEDSEIQKTKLELRTLEGLASTDAAHRYFGSDGPLVIGTGAWHCLQPSLWCKRQAPGTALQRQWLSSVNQRGFCNYLQSFENVQIICNCLWFLLNISSLSLNFNWLFVFINSLILWLFIFFCSTRVCNYL